MQNVISHRIYLGYYIPLWLLEKHSFGCHFAQNQLGGLILGLLVFRCRMPFHMELFNFYFLYAIQAFCSSPILNCSGFFGGFFGVSFVSHYSGKSPQGPWTYFFENLWKYRISSILQAHFLANAWNFHSCGMTKFCALSSWFCFCLFLFLFFFLSSTSVWDFEKNKCSPP